MSIAWEWFTPFLFFLDVPHIRFVSCSLISFCHYVLIFFSSLKEICLWLFGATFKMTWLIASGRGRNSWVCGELIPPQFIVEFCDCIHREGDFVYVENFVYPFPPKDYAQFLIATHTFRSIHFDYDEEERFFFPAISIGETVPLRLPEPSGCDCCHSFTWSPCISVDHRSHPLFYRNFSVGYYYNIKYSS